MTVDKRCIHYATNLFLYLACAYYILNIKLNSNRSKNSELKITLLLVNIIVNKECQHSQNSAVGLYHGGQPYKIGEPFFFFFFFFFTKVIL